MLGLFRDPKKTLQDTSIGSFQRPTGGAAGLNLWPPLTVAGSVQRPPAVTAGPLQRPPDAVAGSIQRHSGAGNSLTTEGGVAPAGQGGESLTPGGSSTTTAAQSGHNN